MSITLRDCLKLPIMKRGQVIAGEKGLTKIIDNVNVIEFENGDEEFQTTNELSLSALYCAKDDVNMQCATIASLNNSGGIGLVLFYADVILGGVHPKLIETANTLNFPLIVMPKSDMMISYSSVISEIMELIFSDKRNKIFLVNEIIERVSQMPEEYQTIDNVLKIISDRIKASLFLSNDRNVMIASAKWPQGLDLEYENVLKKDNNEYTYYTEEFLVKNFVSLTLRVADGNNNVSKELLIQSTKAIELFVVLWNYNLNSSVRESVISAILSSNFSLAEYIKKECNIDQSVFKTMMLIKLPIDKNDREHRNLIIYKLNSIFNKHLKQSIIDYYGSNIVVLFPCERSIAKSNMLKEEFVEYLDSLEINCSYSVFSEQETFKNLYNSYMLYQESIEFAKLIYPLKTKFIIEELSFSKNCYKKLNSVYDVGDKLIKLLQPLYDETDEPLSETLTVYLLDADSEAKKTAELLYIHRNTVQYRLNKIRELLGFDITKFPASIDVYMAVALARLKNHK
ncbi:MAG: PucR family transcriptional regulator [Clostridiales bacterium]|nr:PucR family transcriptional regulator [Clostridiales bacterium]